MPLHTTSDPALRAEDAAIHAGEKVWKETGSGTLSSQAEVDYASGMLREMFSVIPQNGFPPCPNEECACFESPARIGPSAVGGDFYCYECCQTF